MTKKASHCMECFNMGDEFPNYVFCVEVRGHEGAHRGMTDSPWEVKQGPDDSNLMRREASVEVRWQWSDWAPVEETTR